MGEIVNIAKSSERQVQVDPQRFARLQAQGLILGEVAFAPKVILSGEQEQVLQGYIASLDDVSRARVQKDPQWRQVIAAQLGLIFVL